MIITDKTTGIKKDTRLPKDFKKKWIKALRSGEFEQGGGMLHNTYNNTYCCIGVACRVIHPRKDFKGAGLLSMYDTKSFKIPTILKGDNITLSDEYNLVIDKLVEMNDEKKRSFNQIANWIDKNL